MDIQLAEGCTQRHIALIKQYLTNPTTISPSDWRMLLSAFDLLRKSTVTIEKRSYTFDGFYNTFIDTRYADYFIEELQALSHLAEATRLRSRYRKQVIAVLAEFGLDSIPRDEPRCLAAFCVYWWESFAKGYVREIEILRDLAAEGIKFIAHDLTNRKGRMSPFDILIFSMKGDIKTSTYFLFVSRSYPLGSDFYIARLWRQNRRAYSDVVIMKQDAWELIDGDTRTCTFDDVSKVLPYPAELSLFGETLVVVEYALWKDKIKRRMEGVV